MRSDFSVSQGGRSPNGNKRQRSFEEREEDYEKARARIFKQDVSDALINCLLKNPLLPMVLSPNIHLKKIDYSLLILQILMKKLVHDFGQQLYRNP